MATTSFAETTRVVRERMDRTRRLRLRVMIESSGLTLAEAADTLSQAKGKKIAKRTLASWIGDPATASSRKCPAWPLEVFASLMDRGVAK